METQACSFSPFCVGMCEWTGCEAARGVNVEPRPQSFQSEPLPSTATVSSSSEITRFRFASDEQLSELSKGLIPTSTSKSTRWAMKVFNLWSEEWNKSRPQDSVPADLLSCNDPMLLSKHLSQFAVEVRKTNGEPYPPATIHQLLCGLLRHMRETSPGCPNFLDKRFPIQGTPWHSWCTFPHFALWWYWLTRTYRCVTREDEKLWGRGILGTNTPRSLQNAAFFIAGKMFCLRGGEHRSRKLPQLKRMCNPDHYLCTENVSKNINGSFKQLHIKSKIVPVFACPAAGERCPFHILDTYISKLPPQAFERDLFYIRPIETVPTKPTSPWYSAIPVGKNTQWESKEMVHTCWYWGQKKQTIALEQQVLHRCMTEESLKKVIQERTGHRSIEALRCCERTSMRQHCPVSALLSTPTQSSYMEQLYHQSTTSQQMLETKASVSNPSVSFGNVHGCTININTAPSHATTSQSLIDIDVDIDKLFAELEDPQ